MNAEEKVNAESKKQKLPQAIQDTVSPATRLLEKRRIMYEEQEAFETEKRQYEQYDTFEKA